MRALCMFDGMGKYHNNNNNISIYSLYYNVTCHKNNKITAKTRISIHKHISQPYDYG